MALAIPELALVALFGETPEEAARFAAAHFRSNELLSLPGCRGLLGAEADDRAALEDAFDVVE